MICWWTVVAAKELSDSLLLGKTSSFVGLNVSHSFHKVTCRNQCNQTKSRYPVVVGVLVLTIWASRCIAMYFVRGVREFLLNLQTITYLHN